MNLVNAEEIKKERSGDERSTLHPFPQKTHHLFSEHSLSLSCSCSLFGNDHKNSVLWIYGASQSSEILQARKSITMTTKKTGMRPEMMIIISATLNGQWTTTVVMVVDVHKTDTRKQKKTINGQQIKKMKQIMASRRGCKLACVRKAGSSEKLGNYIHRLLLLLIINCTVVPHYFSAYLTSFSSSSSAWTLFPFCPFFSAAVRQSQI